MTRELTRVGNASSLHGSGRTARRVVEESREAIAARGWCPSHRVDLHQRRNRESPTISPSKAPRGRAPGWVAAGRSPRRSNITRSAGFRRLARPFGIRQR